MVEMLASLVIFSILALMAVPMAQTYRDRQTEVTLKDRLARIRTAIRSYAATEVSTHTPICATGPGSLARRGDIDGDGVAGEDGAGDTNGDGINDDDFDGNVDEDGPPIYPPSLEELVKRGYLGSPDLVDNLGASIPAAQQFPRDPTYLDDTEKDNTKTWSPRFITRTIVFRCRGDNNRKEQTITGIFDVRSTSEGTSLSGVKYSDF